MDIQDFMGDEFFKDEKSILINLKKGSIVRFDEGCGDPDVTMKKISDGMFDMKVRIGSGEIRKVAYAMLVCDEIISERVTRVLLNQNNTLK